MSTTLPTTSQSLSIRGGDNSATPIGTRLVGKRLLSKAFSNAGEINADNRDQLAIECGYISKTSTGQLQVDDLDFDIALAKASGLW